MTTTPIGGRGLAHAANQRLARTVNIGPDLGAPVEQGWTIDIEPAHLETERNLIVGIHHYWPVTFTMQGETWMGENEFGHPRDWLGTTWDQTPAQEAELRAGFGAVADWGRSAGRPLFLAEFGTTVHADPASRARWTRFNRHLATEHGIPWGVWSFAPAFAIYDLNTRSFDPSLLAALMD